MPHPSPWTTELRIACAAAKAAGVIQLDGLGCEHDIQQKSSAVDLVTEVDLACEVAIRAAISEAFPDDAILGEEEGGTLLRTGRW